MQIDAGGREIQKLRDFGVFQGAALLAVGCGDGRVTDPLAGRVDCLVALDPSENDLLKAAGRINRALFSRASGEQLPFPGGCFDTILFTLSLHHQDSRRALQEATRVMSPTGRILIMEPAPDGEVQQLFHLFEDETPALASAMSAIADSPLKTVAALSFETEWQFEGRHEFSRYMFAYHDQPMNPAMEDRLFRQIGPRVTQQPLVLKDRLKLIWLAP